MATTTILDREPLLAPAEPASPPDHAQQAQPAPWWRTHTGSARTELWSRAGLLGVIALAAFLFAWDLSRNGNANEYYAAAVYSMTQSWKAFFYGSLDAVGFITVDKPPFALWVQALSARIFGFSSWSILLPQAAEGLATTLGLYYLARRTFGGAAAALAGVFFVLTPITVAVARDNLPDTLLILLMVGGAWGTLDALRTGRLRPLLVAAALVGLAFNTKMLQGYVVLPTLVLTYLALAPVSIGRRMVNLAAAGVVLALVSASWMVVVDSIPLDQRPFIGGSTDGSVLNLVLGYNGLGRILGRDNQFGGAGFGGGANFGGVPGWSRLFNAELGGQISWLMPLAVASLIAGLVARRDRPRTDYTRAWFVLWGGWLATHFVVFSFAEGTFHPYYSSALAPAIAALCGPGLATLWGLYRRSWLTAFLLPTSVLATAAWAAVLIGRSASYAWLGQVVLLLAVAAAAALLLGRLFGSSAGHVLARSAAIAGVVAMLIGPAAWAATPLESGSNGTNPTAGPPDANRAGFGGFPGGGIPAFDQVQAFGHDGGSVQSRGDGFTRADGRAQQPRTGTVAQPDTDPFDRGASFFGGQPGTAGGATPFGGFVPGAGGRGGALSAGLVSYLEANRGAAAWLVAVNSANQAAPIILSTGQPVMAMGGFTGSDPAPTVEQLQEFVSSGQLRFVLLGGGGPGGGARGEVQRWIQANGNLVDPSAYGGSSVGQLYDLSPAAPTVESEG